MTKKLKFLAIWAAVLLVANLAISTAAQAHCKGKHGDDPDCSTHIHESGGQNDRNLEASFCMDFAVVAGPSDLSLSTDDDKFPGSGFDYCDDRNERVSVVTGKRPGFNFSTYTRNGGTWVRWMTVVCEEAFIDDLDWTDSENNDLDKIRCGEKYAMTLRFDQDDGGLDLGALASGGSEEVSIFSGLTAENGDSWLFAHGTVTDPGTSGALADNPCVEETDNLVVTRDSDFDYIWHFSYSGDVCLWDRDASLEFQPGIPVLMNYGFTIVCEDPADCLIVP